MLPGVELARRRRFHHHRYETKPRSSQETPLNRPPVNRPAMIHQPTVMEESALVARGRLEDKLGRFTASLLLPSQSPSVIPVFLLQAEGLVNSSGLPAVQLLAKALANATGYTDMKTRSLLSSMENYVSLLLTAKNIYTPSFAFGILKRFLSDDKIEGVKGLSLTADGMGDVFDVPAADVDTFLKDWVAEQTR